MTLEPFKPVTSKAVVLAVDNIDTDIITPIGRVLEGLDSMVRYAFEPLRYTSDGTLKPDSPLNDPKWEGSEILIAGENFGCGSSRETAVWAVRGLGYRIVIAKGFGDIFFSSCFKNGVLAIQLPPAEVDLLAEAANDLKALTVELEPQHITCEDIAIQYRITALRKEMLADGLDELGLISRREGAIRNFEQTDRDERPWVYLRD